MELPKPKSQTAEILFALITENEISEQQFFQNGFRSRLTELRKLGLNIRDKWKHFKSKYGNQGQYKARYLWRSELPKAKRIYERINKA